MFGGAEGASTGFRFNFQFVQLWLGEGSQQTEEGSIQPKPDDDSTGGGAPSVLRPPARVHLNDANPAYHKIIKKVSSVRVLLNLSMI